MKFKRRKQTDEVVTVGVDAGAGVGWLFVCLTL